MPTNNVYWSILLALCVEIDAGNGPLNLVEADIVESFETGTAKRAYTVVRDKELLLPPHEDILTLR